MSGGNAQPVGRPGDNAQIWGKLGAMPSRFPGRGRSSATSWRIRCRAKCVWGHRNFSNPRGSGDFVGDTERAESSARKARDWGAAEGGGEQCPEIGDTSQSFDLQARRMSVSKEGTQGKPRDVGTVIND